MKITYTPNPLRTTVELDEHEKKELWYKIKIKELEEIVGMAALYVSENPKWFDLEKARKELNNDYIYAESDDAKSGIDKEADRMMGYYLEALQEEHIGDCTCVPCSCIKCHAEDMLGISTTKGLHKHAAHKIQNAFSRKDNPAEGESVWLETERTIDEVLERLKNYDPKPVSSAGWDRVGGWEQYAPRWKIEALSAYEWLLNYKNTYLTKE